MPLCMSWHDYNESLVERGRILFDLGFAGFWKKELKSMNKHKVGRPFVFPDSYIEFLGFLKVGFNAPYRIIEGAVESLSEYISFIKDICFSQIRKRILRLMKGKKPAEMIQTEDGENEPITAIVDSTGLSTTTKGSYIEDKWKKEKRKFLKLHILADKKTGKIADCFGTWKMTDEEEEAIRSELSEGWRVASERIANEVPWH